MYYLKTKQNKKINKHENKQNKHEHDSFSIIPYVHSSVKRVIN